MLAFLVQEQLDHLRRRNHAEFLRMELARLAQHLAQDVVGHAARRFHHAGALAGGADLAQHAGQRFARALARHLHQPQLRKVAHHGLDAVTLQLAAQLGQHPLLVFRPHHVDKVHQDDAAQVAQPHLARNCLRCLQVGLEDGLVKVACTDKAARVNVDGRQRLGLVDHHIAAGFQVDAPAQCAGDFLVDREQVENRPLALVVLQLFGGGGHELFAKGTQQLVLLLRVDADALGVFVHHVAQHALQQAQVLMQQRGRRLAQREFTDARARLAQIAHVLLQFGVAGIFGIGAHDVATRPVQPRLRRQL